MKPCPVLLRSSPATTTHHTRKHPLGDSLSYVTRTCSFRISPELQQVPEKEDKFLFLLFPLPGQCGVCAPEKFCNSSPVPGSLLPFSSFLFYFTLFCLFVCFSPPVPGVNIVSCKSVPDLLVRRGCLFPCKWGLSVVLQRAGRQKHQLPAWERSRCWVAK